MQLTAFASTVLLSALALTEAAPSKIQTCWWSGRDRCANRYQGAWKRETLSYPAVQFDIDLLRKVTDALELNPFKVGRFFGFDDETATATTSDAPAPTGSAATESNEVDIDGLVLTIDAAGLQDFATATGASLDSLKTYFNLV